MMIAERIGKEVELQVKQNDTGHASEEIYPDLRQLINFEIEKMISNFQLDESGKLYYHVA